MDDFKAILDEMRLHNMKVPATRIFFQIQNANEVLKNAMTYFLSFENKKFVWLPEYNLVANWLADNKGKGLFLYGSVGTGKTFITRYVIPAILLKYKKLVVSSFDMTEVNADPEKVLSKRIIALDDIGTEDASVKFGEKRMVIPEILDEAEKYGKLLLITSNLGSKELVSKYGSRIFDRLIEITIGIEFKGKSFRG
jgi:DNA replication protein DnaC